MTFSWTSRDGTSKVMMTRPRPVVHAIQVALVLHLVQNLTGVVGLLSENRTIRVPDEQQLYERIMGGYVKWVRPILNSSQPIKVKFAMRLNQIVSLDERQQVLTTNVFIDQTWTDPALAWDPTEFKDVRALRIPADQVWRPDTFIYNNADNGSTGFIDGTYIQIRHNGAVTWPVPVRLRSSCVVKITYFPFDRQYCMVRFGSWIYSQSLVDYEVRKDVASVDLSSFTKNSEWELLAMRLEKSVVSRTRGHGLHPHLTAVIYLKRNTFFYLFNIIVPCCMLSILTLMTFWLPPTSCEKVTLGLNVFLAFSMFMLLIAEEVPASSDAVPLIGIYLCVVMTMTSMSVLCAVLVTNLHNRGSKLKAAPRWLARLFIRYLAGPMMVSKDVHLLASTIYLPEHSQFFFLHDARWTSKYQRVRTNSDSSSDENPWPPTSRQASQRCSKDNTNTKEKDKGAIKPPRRQTVSYMEDKRQGGNTRSHTLHRSDESPVGYGLTGSWERVTREEDSCSQGEGRGSDYTLRDSHRHSLPSFDMHKGKSSSTSLPGRPEMLQLKTTAQSRLPKPDLERFDKLTSTPIPVSTKTLIPQGSNEDPTKANVNKRILYQETSLCGGTAVDMSPGTEQPHCSKASSLGVVHQASANTTSLFDPHCSSSPYFKSSLKTQPNACSTLSPIDSGSEGTFHQLSPVPTKRPRDISSGCKAAEYITSHHTHCDEDNDDDNDDEDDDDTQSEVWVLRDDFKGSTSVETLAETEGNCSAQLHMRYPQTLPSSLVPQQTPSQKADRLARASAAYPPCPKSDNPIGQNGLNANYVLKRARIMIAEWCIIAKVMDRILFILCLLATLFAYIFILIVVPLEFGSNTGNVTFVNTVNTGRYTWQQS